MAGSSPADLSVRALVSEAFGANLGREQLT